MGGQKTVLDSAMGYENLSNGLQPIRRWQISLSWDNVLSFAKRVFFNHPFRQLYTFEFDFRSSMLLSNPVFNMSVKQNTLINASDD